MCTAHGCCQEKKLRTLYQELSDFEILYLRNSGKQNKKGKKKKKKEENITKLLQSRSLLQSFLPTLKW